MPTRAVNSLLRAAVDNISPREDDAAAFSQVLRSSSAQASLSMGSCSKASTTSSTGPSGNDPSCRDAVRSSRQASTDDVLLDRRTSFLARKKSVGMTSMQLLPTVSAAPTVEGYNSATPALDVYIEEPVTTPRVDESSSSPLQMKIAVTTMEQRAAAWDAFRLHSDASKRQFHTSGVELLDGSVEATMLAGVDAILCPLTSPFGLDDSKWTADVIRWVPFRCVPCLHWTAY